MYTILYSIAICLIRCSAYQRTADHPAQPQVQFVLAVYLVFCFFFFFIFGFLLSCVERRCIKTMDDGSTTTIIIVLRTMHGAFHLYIRLLIVEQRKRQQQHINYLLRKRIPHETHIVRLWPIRYTAPCAPTIIVCSIRFQSIENQYKLSCGSGGTWDRKRAQSHTVVRDGKLNCGQFYDCLLLHRSICAYLVLGFSISFAYGKLKIE